MANVRTCIRKSRSAFSLVELVVVVLIVGILAAVAAPRMFNTSTKAKESAAKASLSVVRNAIELHNSELGSYPTNATALPAALGPYIKGPFPKSPYSGLATIKDGNTQGGPEAWVYEASTGNFWINTTDFANW